MAKVSMSLPEFESLIKEFIGLENLNLSNGNVEFDLCFDIPLMKLHLELHKKKLESEKQKEIQEQMQRRKISLSIPAGMNGCTVTAFDVEIDLEWEDLGVELEQRGINAKISLIKIIRQHTGLGLIEAKCVVDEYAPEILSRWKKYKVTKTLQDMGK